jgi:hypothetical protein
MPESRPAQWAALPDTHGRLIGSIRLHDNRRRPSRGESAPSSPVGSRGFAASLRIGEAREPLAIFSTAGLIPPLPLQRSLGALLFSRDANSLVLTPIERMMKKVKDLAENPLSKQDFSAADGDEQFETKILENAFAKICSLMAVGFGEVRFPPPSGPSATSVLTHPLHAASLRTDICPQRKESSSTSHARNPFNLNFFDSASV